MVINSWKENGIVPFSAAELILEKIWNGNKKISVPFYPPSQKTTGSARG
jgi:hypothetical protein